jgi:lysophospholipase L1-like esterase
MQTDAPLRRALPPLLAAVAAVGLLAPPGGAGDRPEFARWDEAVAAFERQDRDRPPPKGAVLFVGSSSIRLWDLPKSFPGLGVINRGFGGSQLADAAHFASRLVLKHDPRLVVLYAGDNDLAAGKALEQILADFRAFVMAVHQGLPKTRVLFLSIKPSPRRWALVGKVRKANALVEAECRGHEGLRYVDVFTPMLGADGKPRPELFGPDGLHLSAEGYALWATALKPYLT